ACIERGDPKVASLFVGRTFPVWGEGAKKNGAGRGKTLIWRKLVPHLLLWWHRTQARVEVK
ncbi:hypothetical protein NL539_16575, partial [Aeromonas sp. CPF2-S1]|nr:hypothetical protein [Aeromonas sp. CPF2-S1]